MYSLKESLKNSLKRLGVEKKLREKRIVDLWDNLRNGELINHTRGNHFTNGILFVTVSSSVWSQQLIFLKANFIRQINQELGGKFLKDIRFQCGVVKNEARINKIEGQAIPKLGEISLDREEILEIEKTIEIIKEDDLRNKLKAFLIKGKKLHKWREIRGWKTCLLCSCLYPQEEKRCPFCSYELEVKKILFSNPWLDWAACQEKIPGLGEAEYRTLREKVVKDLWNNLNLVLEKEILQNINGRLAKKWLNSAQIYVILKTGLNLDLINKEIIYSVLGQKLAEIFYSLAQSNKSS